jgi:hypothetical protein
MPMPLRSGPLRLRRKPGRALMEPALVRVRMPLVETRRVPPAVVARVVPTPVLLRP